MALLRQGAARGNSLLASGRDAWRVPQERASRRSRRAFASSPLDSSNNTTEELRSLSTIALASSSVTQKASRSSGDKSYQETRKTAWSNPRVRSLLLGASLFGCGALLASNAHTATALTEGSPGGGKTPGTQASVVATSVPLEKLNDDFADERSLRKRRSAGRDRLLISTAAVRGDRSRMEDTSFVSDCKRFNAVFDGHGGAAVSTYIQKQLFPLIAPGLAHLDQAEGEPNEVVYKKLRELIQQAMEKVDTEVLARPEWRFQGTTATGVMLYDEVIMSFNVGDSRAVMSRAGQTIELTRDHKPNDPTERLRIEKLGGTVKWYGYVDAQGEPIEPYGAYRVNGNLAVGRAIGDRDLRPYVSGEVEIKEFSRDFDKDEFIVIASDGLWDVFTSEEAVTFVHDVLSGELGGRESWRSGAHSDTSVPIFEWSHQYKSDRGMIKAARARRKVQIANYLVQEALFRGTSDNVSVIVVWLK